MRQPEAVMGPDERMAARRLVEVTAGHNNLPDGLVPEVDGRPVEPWSPEAARQRLRRVAPKVPLLVPASATILPGDSNDAWMIEDCGPSNLVAPATVGGW